MIIDFNAGDGYTKAQIDAMIANCVTTTTDDLINYYLKSETYTQTEVQNLIAAIDQFHYEIVPSTASVQDPQTNVLYLVGPVQGVSGDAYEEYVYTNSTWTKIGDTSIDLSGYVTTSALQTALNNYVLASSLATVATSGNIGDLSDVTITTPTNGQVMKYNATTQKWENGTGGGGGNTVELTQTQYDALQVKDPDTTYIITDADTIDMDDYALVSDITTLTSGKADKQNVTANTNAMKFPHWNEQGVITGSSSSTLSAQGMYINGGFWRIFTDNWSNGTIYGPTSAGTSGQIVKSNGSGAPSWVDFYSTYTGGLKFWLGTQAQYTALSPNYDSSCLYVITD